MRGQFVRGDGLILPNNVSLAGAEVILRGAFRLTPQAFFAALVTGAPTKSMTQADMVEPAIGTNGYARQAITQDAVGWPTIGTVASERYIESAWVTFEAVGGDFSAPVQRVALLGYATLDLAHPIFALSALMPEEITITPATPLANRRFKYQFFL